jgi:hypothetical protein
MNGKAECGQELAILIPACFILLQILANHATPNEYLRDAQGGDKHQWYLHPNRDHLLSGEVSQRPKERQHARLAQQAVRGLPLVVALEVLEFMGCRWWWKQKSR